MLTIVVLDDGGVRITGTQRQLRDLAQWCLQAAVEGFARPAFRAADRIVHIEITAAD